MSTQRFVLGLSLILSLSILWGFVESRSQSSRAGVQRIEATFVADYTVTQQKATKRYYTDWSPKRLGSFETPSEVKQASQIAIGQDGALFVLDGSDGAVKVCSERGEFLMSFHDHRAPRPTHFAVDSNDGIWVSDPNGRVIGFGPDGKVNAVWPQEIRVIRLVALQTGLFFTMAAPLSEHLFATRTLDGISQKDFGLIVTDQHQHGVLLVGHLTLALSGELIVYIPQFGGFIASYHEDGSNAYRVSTIEPPPLPRMEITPSGARRLPRDLPVTVRNVASGGGQIYVVSQLLPQWGPSRTVVDVYDAGTGSYQYSTQALEQLSAIAVNSYLGQMYSASDHGIVKWEGLP